MWLYHSTKEFIYKKKSCSGVPILAYDDQELCMPANDFLLWLSLECGKSLSPKTWKNYGKALFDYFSFLEASGLKWDDPPSHGEHGEEITNIAMYRNVSVDLVDRETGKRRLKNTTINNRLACLKQFYRWAKNRGLINFKPWEEEYRVLPEKIPDMMRHTRSARVVKEDSLKLKTQKTPPKILNLKQCQQLIHACKNSTLQLMVRLMLGTGLRNVECRTFPVDYVLNPEGKNRDIRLPIQLDPDEMEIKHNKPRTIYITWPLMNDLHQYLKFGEGPKRAKMYQEKHGHPSPFLFLNRFGEPFYEMGLNVIFKRLREERLDFYVTPHMLRHTFATMELQAEIKKRGGDTGGALSWVRDRMGHSSVSTTSIYLHCIDLREDQELNEYQNELDQMIGS